jgi:diacylglycerol kinase (ATP)
MSFINPHKQRKGWVRLWYATGYSLQGLQAACREAAFRLELLLCLGLSPLAFWLGQRWSEVALLLASLVWVLIAELLNTAIESVVDRFGPEWHLLSKKAKDVGSAATLLTLLLAAGIWGAALWQYWAS